MNYVFVDELKHENNWLQQVTTIISWIWIYFSYFTFQLRPRRALMQFKYIPLRTRRALALYKVYRDSARLVLNGTLLNSINALLALSRQYKTYIKQGCDYQKHYEYMCVYVCVCEFVSTINRGHTRTHWTFTPRTTLQTRTVHDLWIRANGCKLPTLAYRGMLKKKERK